MKLAYNIPGKLWWIHNFLPYPLYKGIHDAILKERKDIKFKDTTEFWKKYLYKDLVPPVTALTVGYPPFERLKTLIKHNQYFDCPKLNHMSTTIHFLKKGSGINWHNDGNWTYGASYYINHSWNKNWGGEFMFNDQNGFGFLPVIGNSIIIVKTPLDHKVNNIISPIMPRVSIQLFMR